MEDIEEKLITLREAAKTLSVSTQTLKRWHKKGKLIPIVINERGDRRYKLSTIVKFYNS